MNKVGDTHSEANSIVAVSCTINIYTSSIDRGLGNGETETITGELAHEECIAA